MGTGHFSDDVKRDGGTQITGRGYPGVNASARTGLPGWHSLRGARR